MSSLPFLGAVTLLTLAVLAWLMYPLLKAGSGAKAAQASRRALNAAIYRDQLAELERDRAAGSLAASDFEQARDELQHRLLQDAAGEEAATAAMQPARRTAVTLALALPLGAALLYLWLGHPAALTVDAAGQQITARQIDEMVAKLAARMEQNPDDMKGWTMLARSYKALRRFDEAEKAFAHLAPVLDSNPDLLTDYADLLALRAGGNLEGKPLELVMRALKLDPTHTMALALAGTAAYNRQDFAEATRHWEALLKVLPPESDDAKALTATLAEIREKSGVKAEAGTAKGAAKSATSAGAEAIQGQARLAPALASKVQPDDTLFIYARAVDGPRMPLAVLRQRAADLPLSFTLDDTLALNPQMKLSTAKQVKIEARISKSGQATPQPGDLLGESDPVKPGARKVTILIERVLP